MEAQYNIRNAIDNASPLEHKDGYYLRLTGKFSSSDELVIIFNSVKHGGE